MIKFVDTLGIPTALALPLSGTSGEVVFYNGKFYGWSGAQWDILNSSAFTTSATGLVPSPITTTGRFLKDDGTWSGITPYTATWVITANSTGASQSITIPDTGLAPQDVLLTIGGLVQEPADYTISGTTLTVTAPDSGLSILVRRLPTAITPTSYGPDLTSPIQSNQTNYSISAYASKGNVITTVRDIRINVVNFGIGTTANYKFFIAKLSNSNDILQILYEGASVSRTGGAIATEVIYPALQISGGTRLGVFSTVQGGTGTTANTVSFPSVVGSNSEGWVWNDCIRWADNSPTVGEVMELFGPTASVGATIGFAKLEVGDTPSSNVDSISATTYDLLAIGNKKYHRFTNAATKTLTVRPDAIEALPENGEWHVRNVGAGNLTIVQGSGVTINPPFGGTLIIPQGGTVTIKRVAINEFDLLGQTTAA